MVFELGFCACRWRLVLALLRRLRICSELAHFALEVSLASPELAHPRRGGLLRLFSLHRLVANADLDLIVDRVFVIFVVIIIFVVSD